MEKCKWCLDGGMNEKYHDEEWGDVVHDDRKQFEFIMLEAMQCGLSWTLMLKKREIFRKCFDNFDYNKIASYNEIDIERILNSEGMIKSIGKIKAIINNAKCFIKIIEKYGSFDKYLWSFSNGYTLVYKKHHLGFYDVKNDLSDAISLNLKKEGFKYLGSITVYSHLQACGMINDHDINCFKYKKLLDNKMIKFID